MERRHLTEVSQADTDDVIEAYAKAGQSQQNWAAKPPVARADFMRNAADVMSARKDEITAFGGEKASGIGGQWAVGEFTTEHWVSVQREPRQYPI